MHQDVKKCTTSKMYEVKMCENKFKCLQSTLRNKYLWNYQKNKNKTLFNSFYMKFILFYVESSVACREGARL